MLPELQLPQAISRLGVTQGKEERGLVAGFDMGNAMPIGSDGGVDRKSGFAGIGLQLGSTGASHARREAYSPDQEHDLAHARHSKPSLRPWYNGSDMSDSRN